MDRVGVSQSVSQSVLLVLRYARLLYFILYVQAVFYYSRATDLDCAGLDCRVLRVSGLYTMFLLPCICLHLSDYRACAPMPMAFLGLVPL